MIGERDDVEIRRDLLRNIAEAVNHLERAETLADELADRDLANEIMGACRSAIDDVDNVFGDLEELERSDDEEE